MNTFSLHTVVVTSADNLTDKIIDGIARYTGWSDYIDSFGTRRGDFWYTNPEYSFNGDIITKDEFRERFKEKARELLTLTPSFTIESLY